MPENKVYYKYGKFTSAASRLVRLIAHPWTFLAVLLLAAGWCIAGFIFGFTETWLDICWSVTAIVTFLLVFLLQHTQAREMASVQLKLNELIRSSEGAHNALLDIEELSTKDYDQLKSDYNALARQAREQLRAGQVGWATARVQMESFDNLMDVDSSVSRTNRISALHELQVLDSPEEETYDTLTRIAANALQAPIALISLVDENRQWFKSQIGLPEPLCSLRETPLSDSLCKFVVVSQSPVVIDDTTKHPYGKSHPGVKHLDIGAYLGVPLVTNDGLVLGAFCVIDHKARQWTVDNINLLNDMAALAMKDLDALHTNKKNVPLTSNGLADSLQPDIPQISKQAATIMIIDDSSTSRLMAQKFLQDDGYQTLLPPDSSKGLDIIAEISVDLVLLDIMMPGIDGEQVLAHMRSTGALTRTKVIMMSALDDLSNAERYVHLGASGFLAKPLHREELLEKTRQVLRGC